MAGAVVQVKSAANAGSGTTIASGTLVSNVTSGNFLYIVANAGDNVTMTPSQNSGSATLGAFTSRGSVLEAGVLDKLEHWTCPITGTGTLDILITYGSSIDHINVMVAEVSGVLSYDVDAEVTDTGSNPTPNNSVTVTTQPAFGLSFVGFYQGGTPTAGTGWTSHTAVWTGVTDALLQTKAITSTGSLTANFGNATLDRNNAVMVVFTEPSPPVITAQPVQQTASVDATATFTLTATDVTTYQWQTATNGETWSNVGTNSNSYTTGTLAAGDNGKYVRCVLTNASGTTNSVTAQLFMRGQAITGKGEKLNSAWVMQRKRRMGYSGSLLRKEIQPGDINDAERAMFSNWWFPSTSTGYTLTAEAGALAITGSAATLKVGRRLTAAAGSLTLTGTAATLRRGYTLAAAGGSLTITGSAATLRRTYVLSANGGSLAITGTAATLKTGRRLSADSGALSLSGSAATLRRGLRLTAASGALSITGAAATLRKTFLLAAAGGALSISGTAATLRRGLRLPADSGALALSGGASGLRATRRLSADGGSLSITGSAATLKRGLRLSAASGALTITGSDATLTYTPNGATNYTLVAASGSLSITGTAAVLRRGLRIDAAGGALAITGSAVTLRRSLRLPADGGTLAISGTAATLRRTVRLDAAAGSLSLTGTAASLKTGRLLVADSGALGITGGAASLLYSGAAPPPSSNFLAFF